MNVKYGDFIWYNGKYIKWNDAQIHIMSHVVHYGSSVFEGIRAYDTNNGPAIYRLKDHIRRLLDSARIYRMDIAWNVDQLCAACVETITKNNMGACYIRPVIFRGFGTFGVDPIPNPVETYIAIWEWGKYLGPEALENGVDACFSSWNRMSPNTFPAMAKTGANYMNSQLIKMEAMANGYAEGIALDANGFISEGSGENIFIIRDNKIYTPPISASILPGITRDTVIHILGDLGYTVIETPVPRELVYIADEVFFTGTAAEVTPVRTIDKIPVGPGKRGPITQKVQEEFFSIFSGKRRVPADWLTPVK